MTATTCAACGHLAALRPCQHARAPETAPLDAAIAMTAVALAIAVLAAQPYLPPWLAAWAYFAAIAIAAWIPGWVVVPLAGVGIAVTVRDASALPGALGQAAIAVIAVIVIRRARAQRDELVARRAATSG